jgi:hypothetical protein
MLSALKKQLSSCRAGVFAVVSGLLLASTSLDTGLAADDYFHKLVLTGTGAIPGIPSDPLDMFVWASGDREQARAYMDVGMTGWWTDPDYAIAFWRPVTVFTHWLDYQLWPGSPWLMHLHSLLWFGLALLALSRLYRRLLPLENAPWIAALALLMFAWDDAHGLTIAWIANRNALVALFFALLVLLLHDRARRDGDRASAWLGPVLLAVALQAGESALGICAYLFSYALFVDPAGRRRGLLRIAPHALVAVVWAGLYYAAGYGARGSGLVTDPIRDPLTYLGQVFERLPVLLVAQVAFPPADLWEGYPVLGRLVPLLVLGWALLVLVCIGSLLRPLLARQRTARFWLCSTLLCGLPACAQFPHDRLLMFIGVGATALLAQFLGAFVEGGEWLRAGPFARRALPVFAYPLLVLHLVIAPLWLPLRARGPADVTRVLERADATIESDATVRDKSVILLNPPADAFAGYIPTMRAATGRNRPAHLRWLATGASEVKVERVDRNSLRVTPAVGFLSLASEHMQRSPRKRMAVGQVIRLTDLRITVTRVTPDGRPAEILARFSRPLEYKRFVFLQWSGHGFRPFPLPPVGSAVTLPPADFVSLLL